MACTRLARLMGYHAICLAPDSQAAARLQSAQYPPHEVLIKSQTGIVGVVEEMKRKGGARAVMCEFRLDSVLGARLS